MIKKSKTLSIFLKLFELLLVFSIGILYYLTLPFHNESVVYIPQGSISKIIADLDKKNYKMSKIDEFALRILGQPQAGWINLDQNPLNRIEFLYKLTTAKAAIQTITLIPGETSLIFLEQLAKELTLDKNKLLAEFNKQSPYIEGTFYPETYHIPRGISEDLLIKYLLRFSEEKYKNIAKRYLGIDNLESRLWRDIIIAASVVQKEAANNDEMQIVASVIYNRLKIGMKLQMDGTLNYGVYSHIKITPERIRNDESSYNTYKFQGLPKEAVCNVSVNAIQAVLAEKRYREKNNKGSTNYLYFMRDKRTGKHIFTTNAKDHNKAVEAQRNN